MLSWNLNAQQNNEINTLKSLLKSGRIAINAIAAGGFNNKVLKLSIKNKTTKNLQFIVDPALIFEPLDSIKVQPLITAGSEIINIPANKDVETIVHAFCGNATYASPRQNLKYRFSKQGNQAMINIANYIVEHKMFKNGGQNAIWSITNAHSLSSVYSPWIDAKQSKQFVEYVAKQLNTRVPDFYTVNKALNISGNGPIYNSCIDKIYVDIIWKNALYRRNVRLVVLREDGSIYTNVKSNFIGLPNGESHIKLEFDPLKDPAGKYIVRLRTDDNEIIENKIVEVMSGCTSS